MRARLTGFAVALLTTVAAAGLAGAQPSYPCTETNDNLPNPYRLIANWASPPRPWMPVNAVAVDAQNNLWAADRCETDDCIPVIQLSPEGRPCAILVPAFLSSRTRWRSTRTAMCGWRTREQRVAKAIR